MPTALSLLLCVLLYYLLGFLSLGFVLTLRRGISRNGIASLAVITLWPILVPYHTITWCIRGLRRQGRGTGERREASRSTEP